MNNHPYRKPTRAPGFDYREPGAYFITICEHRRCNRFGIVVDREMRLNGAGDMVRNTWRELLTKHPTATFDEFVVMPNHVHGLVTLAAPEPDLVGEALRGLPTSGGPPSLTPEPDLVGVALRGLPTSGGPPSLTDIVGWFKTMSTNWYMHGVHDYGWPLYDGHLWQRSFHDRIVRNDAELDRIRAYISNNPALWRQDTFYEP